MYAMGAQGIQVGTLFLSAEECPVPATFKQAVLDADDTATIVTGRRNGAPVRSIKNKMLTKFKNWKTTMHPVMNWKSWRWAH